MVTVIPAIENAAKELFAQLNVYKDLKFYPSDLTANLADQYGVSSPEVLRNKFKNLYDFSVQDFYKKNNLVGLDPRYSKALADYLSLTKDEKQAWGIKRELLGKHGLKASKQEYKYFSQFLKNIGELVDEVRPKMDADSHGARIDKLIRKGSHPSIEGALSGKLDTPNMITIFGKKGDKTIQKGHLTAKVGEFGTPGTLGYIPKIVNEAFGFQQQDTERLRDTLENHMKKVADKFKQNKNGFYKISDNKNSIDQTRFNNALQRVFGKTSGKVPIKKYLELLNLEAEQIGRATDGLITARPIDTQTFEFMKGVPPGSNPKYNIGASMDPKYRDLSFKEIRKAYDVGDKGPIKALESAGNEVFLERLLNTKKNIKKADVYSISDRIKQMFKTGLINYDNTPDAKIKQYTRITELADMCSGKLATGGRVKFVKGANVCQQAINATKALDDTEFVKIASESSIGQKLGAAATALRKFGPAAGKYGAIAAAGALAQPLVKQFRNDDPSTYLTDENQIKGMLEGLIETQERTKPRSEILDWGMGAGQLGATAAAVPGSGALYKFRRGLSEAKIPKAGPITEGGLTAGDYLSKHAGKDYGKLRAGAGVGMKLLSGMFTPAGLLATEPLRIAQKRREGESWGDIATSPMTWMGPAFAPSMTKIATAGMKKGSL